MAVLVVAALSARLLAEAAARDGHRVIALDLFGDADTRRVAEQWLPIGRPEAPRIDSDRVLEALRRLSQPPFGEVTGWIAGSGFEGQPSLIAAGAELLPLVGTRAADVRRVRDPALFFGALAARGIDHPPTQAAAPADTAGWLSKDANGCGGWHIRPATRPRADASASRYFQRELQGTPMSATFIANGRDVRVIGCNELLVRPAGAHPHVYRGCVGPVPVAAGVARRVAEAVGAVAAEFALRGWCSLDFIRDGDAVRVLEVNPRPPASLALYAPRGQIDAQLAACLRAELPPQGAFAPPRTAGSRIVFARRAMQLDDAAARRLANWPNVHDIPAAGIRFAAGDPVCSLSAEAESASAVRTGLEAGHDALLSTLET